MCHAAQTSLAKGQTHPPHCNGGVCRQLQCSTSDYTISKAFFYLRVTKISHEWRNPSTDWSDAAWTQFLESEGNKIYFSSSFALWKQEFHSAICCQAFLTEMQREPGTSLSLAFCPSTENTHTEFTFHFKTHHIWLQKERPLFFFLANSIQAFSVL